MSYYDLNLCFSLFRYKVRSDAYGSIHNWVGFSNGPALCVSLETRRDWSQTRRSSVFPVPCDSSKVFAKVNAAQFPSRFLSD